LIALMTFENEDLAQQLRAATELLIAVAQDRSVLAALSTEERSRLLSAAGDVFCPDVEERRQQIRARRRSQRAAKAQRDQDVLNSTEIRTLRAQEVFTSPNVFPPVGFVQTDLPDAGDYLGSRPFRETLEPQHCYVCKEKYSQIHFFYDQLCPRCAELNYAKRTESANLEGRVALLTGGRVKIGYQAGIKLLRAGARLVVTTRFPQDSAQRYSQEPDFFQWKDRLEIYGLDLRHTPSVEAFCSHMAATHSRLDYIINNACQTVRRPPEFYEHMMQRERSAHNELLQPQGEIAGSQGNAQSHASALVHTATGTASSAEISQLPLLKEDRLRQGHLFPDGLLDQDLQQVDLRELNSWRLNLAQVSTVEMLETQLVNAVAPFVLNARLKPLMLQTPDQDKHIVNVSAVEGQFYRRFKTTKHPHTNMAKAALNMMTRTSAAEYHADGIHMNSVDTGWVSDEDPAHIAERKTAEHGFHPPLDIVDGAARIVDPIIGGVLTGTNVWGQFLKDYFPTDW
jgi:NAD(P)-dependent dehydrogenase (short-subunit alcohol dehydrogenase family)